VATATRIGVVENVSSPDARDAEYRVAEGIVLKSVARSAEYQTAGESALKFAAQGAECQAAEESATRFAARSAECQAAEGSATRFAARSAECQAAEGSAVKFAAKSAGCQNAVGTVWRFVYFVQRDAKEPASDGKKFVWCALGDAEDCVENKEIGARDAEDHAMGSVFETTTF